MKLSSATAYLFASTLVVAIASGQTKAEIIAPVRVCEVLAKLSDYAGRDVAIVGRGESDETQLQGYFLAEDRCQKPARTGDFVWPSRIAIECEELPDAAKLVLNEVVLTQKIAEL